MQREKSSFTIRTSWTDHPGSEEGFSRIGKLPIAVRTPNKRVRVLLTNYAIDTARWRTGEPGREWVVLHRNEKGEAVVSVKETHGGDDPKNPHGRSFYKMEVLAPPESQYIYE